MSFSVIAKNSPVDDAGWGRWHLEHAREHRQMTGALLSQSPPVASIEYPIERMVDVNAWLNAHQEMSQSVWSGAGGGESPDFRTVDWKDEKDLANWLIIHAQWHSQMRTTLGL